MIRAVVFDFDGVLANSEPLHFQAFHEVLAAQGISLSKTDYYGKYLGFDDFGAFRAVAADEGVSMSEDAVVDLVHRKARRMEALERDRSVLFPGAREAIQRMASRGPTAIASGALRAEILRVLEREQLTSYFPVLVAAEDTPASKPDPAPYALAARLLSESSASPLAPAECVAIEDSHWGLESARRAGLRTIAITHSYAADALASADAIVDHLDQLTGELLATLAR